MKSKLHSSIIAAASTLAVAVVAGNAFADPVKWDFSDEYGGNPSGLTYQAAQYCIAEVEKIAGDAIDITYQGGGALGFKSADHFEAVGDGAVQSAVTLLTQLSGVDPLFNLSSLPFVASSPEQAHQLWQIARPEYAKVFEANNQILLWALPNAPSGIHAKTPINSVAAVTGLRIRTYDKNGTDTLKAAGAAPLQIAWSDLVPQLSTGGVDAVLTSADGGKQIFRLGICQRLHRGQLRHGLVRCACEQGMRLTGWRPRPKRHFWTRLRLATNTIGGSWRQAGPAPIRS